MDAPNITLLAIIIIPVVLMLGLRINATLVFLSLCLGSVLLQFVSDDANEAAGLFSAQNPGVAAPDNSFVQLFLLLAPVLLTTIFMIRTVNGKLRLLLNILPAVGVGLLGALLVVPLLPPGLSHNIVDSAIWDEVSKAKSLIVGATALVCLLVLWLQRPKTGHDGKRGKHKG